jgi:hypothetical protein
VWFASTGVVYGADVTFCPVRASVGVSA